MAHRVITRVTKLNYTLNDVIGMLKDAAPTDLDITSLPRDAKQVRMQVDSVGMNLTITYERVQVPPADQLKITHDRNQ